MVVLIERLGEPHIGLGIDPVVDVRAIDPDQHDLPATLHGDLRRRVERDVGHFRLCGMFVSGLGCRLLASRGERQNSAQRGRRLQEAAAF